MPATFSADFRVYTCDSGYQAKIMGQLNFFGGRFTVVTQGPGGEVMAGLK
ncbi:hypothetical protein [Nitrosospira sp. NpAV]|nr:hypothetical protein [Nitrosospira sp. NpAV]